MTKYTIIPILFFTVLSQSVFSQQSSDSVIIQMKDNSLHKFDISKEEDLKVYRTFNIQSEEVKTCYTKADKGLLYFKPEIMPEYAGGTDKFMEYVRQSLVYPTDAPKKGKGKTELIYIQCIITTNGDVEFYKVLKGETESFINEAKRVFELSPKWKPGMVENLPVDVLYIFTCMFSYK